MAKDKTQKTLAVESQGINSYENLVYTNTEPRSITPAYLMMSQGNFELPYLVSSESRYLSLFNRVAPSEEEIKRIFHMSNTVFNYIISRSKKHEKKLRDDYNNAGFTGDILDLFNVRNKPDNQIGIRSKQVSGGVKELKLITKEFPKKVSYSNIAESFFKTAIGSGTGEAFKVSSKLKKTYNLKMDEIARSYTNDKIINDLKEAMLLIETINNMLNYNIQFTAFHLKTLFFELNKLKKIYSITKQQMKQLKSFMTSKLGKELFNYELPQAEISGEKGLKLFSEEGMKEMVNLLDSGLDKLVPFLSENDLKRPAANMLQGMVGEFSSLNYILDNLDGMLNSKIEIEGSDPNQLNKEIFDSFEAMLYGIKELTTADYAVILETKSGDKLKVIFDVKVSGKEEYIGETGVYSTGLKVDFAEGLKQLKDFSQTDSTSQAYFSVIMNIAANHGYSFSKEEVLGLLDAAGRSDSQKRILDAHFGLEKRPHLLDYNGKIMWFSEAFEKIKLKDQVADFRWGKPKLGPYPFTKFGYSGKEIYDLKIKYKNLINRESSSSGFLEGLPEVQQLIQNVYGQMIEDLEKKGKKARVFQFEFDI